METAQPEMIEEIVDADLQVGAQEMAWSQVWQLPALLLGVGLLALGLYMALPKYVAPDYEKDLQAIDARLKQGQLEEAEERLVVMGESDFAQKAPEELVGFYWQLYGDLRYRQLDQHVWRGITTPAGQKNLGQIVGHYSNAQAHQRDLPVAALRRYAQALAALGDDKAALAIVDQMPMQGASAQRHGMIRKLIERRLQTDPDPASEQLANLIHRYEEEIASESDGEIQLDGKIWATGIRCERLLRTDGGEQSVIRLLVDGGLIRLKHEGASDQQLVPLNILLGEAYAASGNHINARLRLDQAQKHMEGGDVMASRMMLALGNIELAEDRPGAVDRAFGHFRQAYQVDKLGPYSIQALTGIGHTEANREGRFSEAIDAFGQVSQRLVNEEVPVWDSRRETAAHYLNVHIERSYGRGEHQNMLDLLKIYEPLADSPDSPQLLHDFARAYKHLAEHSLELAKALEPDPNHLGDDPHLEARRIHNQDAAMNFERAADYYRLEAEQLTGTTDAHGVALWAAAENYTSAQRWRKAVEVYNDYLASRGEDAKREEAMFRLGQAYLAGEQYAVAVEKFSSMIEVSDTSEWAKLSYVPLAQAYAALGEWDRAEQSLIAVVDDHRAIGPESALYRDALIELGALYYRRGAIDDTYYAKAIERLGESGGAIERYGHLPEFSPRLRYMLAQSLRLRAEALESLLGEVGGENERLGLQDERKKNLSDAKIYYGQVRTELGESGRTLDSLSPIQRLRYRNAHFYEADCAYELRDFAAAINLYTDAAEKWRDHPSALVGWVQVLNAESELGNHANARAAHAKAIDIFESLPPEVFDRPDSLMSHQKWDEWLHWSTVLELYPGGQAQAGVVENVN